MLGETAITHPAKDIPTDEPSGESNRGFCQRTEYLGMGRTGPIGAVGQFADHLKRPVQRVDAVVTVVADGQVVATDGALLLLHGQDLLRKNGVGWPRVLIAGLPTQSGEESTYYSIPHHLRRFRFPPAR